MSFCRVIYKAGQKIEKTWHKIFCEPIKRGSFAEIEEHERLMKDQKENIK